MNEKIICNFCGCVLTRKNGKCINHIWSCKRGECFLKRRKIHREYLKRDILHIRKRSPKGTRKETFFPKIKGFIEKKKKGLFKSLDTKKKINYFGIYLTKDEKYVLYKKYQAQGLDYPMIKEKIKRDTEYLDNLIKKLREEKIEEETINKKFKEEFAKLIGGGENYD